MVDSLAAPEIADFTSLLKEDLKGPNLEQYQEENKSLGLKAKRKKKEDSGIQPRGLGPTYEKGRGAKSGGGAYFQKLLRLLEKSGE